MKSSGVMPSCLRVVEIAAPETWHDSSQVPGPEFRCGHVTFRHLATYSRRCLDPFPLMPSEELMIQRRTFAFAAVAAALFAVPLIGAAWAAQTPFSDEAFKRAQAAGKPILIDVYASWCPICRAQQPILSELTAQSKFKDLTMFRIEWDTQKDAVKRFGVTYQSTLIVFKGATETGRIVGDSRRESIAALLDKTQ
jgi:thioredoxin 1